MMTLLFWFFVSVFAPAQGIGTPFPSDAQVLSQQGSLFKVSVAKGEPIKIFVLGRQEAEIDLRDSEWKVEIDPSDLSIRVRRVGAKSSRILKLERQKNYFVIAEPVSDEKVYTLEVTTEKEGKKEVFNFKIDNRPK